MESLLVVGAAVISNGLLYNPQSVTLARLQALAVGTPIASMAKIAIKKVFCVNIFIIPVLSILTLMFSLRHLQSGESRDNLHYYLRSKYELFFPKRKQILMKPYDAVAYVTLEKFVFFTLHPYQVPHHC